MDVLVFILLLQCITVTFAIIPVEYCKDWTQIEDYLSVVVPDETKKNVGQRQGVHTDSFSENRKNYKSFDFIIVGSGPAGSVLANRLTENPNWDVLLLEVGETPTNATDIPALANLLQSSDYNWKYIMEPQENAGLGLNDRKMYWPRGKVLGGTSTINACVHTRGNRRNFDRWAIRGNEGWSFEDVLPYFKKSEDFLVKFQDPGYHQIGGLLGVSDVPYRSESSAAFVDAMQEFGYKYVDYNGAEQMGVSYAHGTIRNGRRSGAYNAYIEPFLNRTNLHVYTEAMVTKILIKEAGKDAVGVEYVMDGVKNVALAKKEVIVSAGCFSSPQLLMLSGIGPREHLQDLGIEVISDLQVGQNLLDHIGLYGLTFTLNQSIGIPYNEIETNPKHMEDFLRGEGILTTLTGTEAIAIVQTPASNDPDPLFPDVELIFIGASSNTGNGSQFKKLINVRDDVYEAIWRTIEDLPAVTILPMLVDPKSKGYLQLRSRNPYDHPKLYGNYFTDPENQDVKSLIASARMVQEIVEMSSFQKYGAKLVEPTIPGCKAYEYNTDEFWECVVRHIGITANHQVGTCKMGPDNDPEAVVDPKLRVYGIRRLRVADTSVLPTQIAGHTNIVSFMIGEKLADILKESWE